MISQPYTLAFYSPSRQRVLLLNSAFPVQSINRVLASYNIGPVSFVNEFYGGAFTCRHYVYSNELSPVTGIIYDLKADPLLQGQYVSHKPFLNWKLILATDPKSLPISTNIHLFSLLFRSTNPDSR